MIEIKRVPKESKNKKCSAYYYASNLDAMHESRMVLGMGSGRSTFLQIWATILRAKTLGNTTGTRGSIQLRLDALSMVSIVIRKVVGCQLGS